MKTTYENDKTWIFNDKSGAVLAAYLPDNKIDDQYLWQKLAEVPFTRVLYISKYEKANRTPRSTWAYGQVNVNKTNPDFDPVNPSDQYNKLRVIPNPETKDFKDVVSYRGLDFESEIMPDWLEGLSQYCRMTAIMNWGFDPCYNSVIIGRYDEGDDQIGFHFDTETFLAHHFCANVTLGYPRDFQFKILNDSGTKDTHEIKLGHASIFFFLGLEHALPKRTGVKTGEIRYSISFRNMANNIGIGNSFYYCRGLAGAVDNQNKTSYSEKLLQLQLSK